MTTPCVPTAGGGEAAASGYSAIVVTLDNGLVGWRTRDLGLKCLPFLGGPMANYFSDPVFRSRLAKPLEQDPAAAVMLWEVMTGV